MECDGSRIAFEIHVRLFIFQCHGLKEPKKPGEHVHAKATVETKLIRFQDSTNPKVSPIIRRQNYGKAQYTLIRKQIANSAEAYRHSTRLLPGTSNSAESFGY
jgi:hypothetical protein